MSIVDSSFADQDYTFESGDEGWTYDVEANRVVFGEENWEVQDSTQINQHYTFEMDEIVDMEIVQSINAYSMAKISASNRDNSYISRNRDYNGRRTLQQVDIEVDDRRILRGEID